MLQLRPSPFDGSGQERCSLMRSPVGTEVVPCLAGELEKQALRLESGAGSFDDVYDSLDLCYKDNAHSNRDLSLFDTGNISSPWIGDLDTYEFPSLDNSEVAVFAWGGQENTSEGPSSAASCDQSHLEALDRGTELSSRKMCSSTSVQDVLPDFGSVALPVNKQEYNGNWDAEDVVNQQYSNSNWRSGMEQYKTSFIAAPCVSAYNTTDHWGDDAFGTLTIKTNNARKLSTGTQLSSDTAHALCRSPGSHASGISTDLSIELVGSIDDDLLGADLYNDASPVAYTGRQKQMALERAKKASRQEAAAVASPLATGTKRPASTPGAIARKLMSHPEGNSCAQCRAKSTPVWRAGPLGPKTLCNACGVRYSKFVRKK
eukprot:gene30443-35453_t